MTDKPFTYTYSATFCHIRNSLGAQHVRMRPRRPQCNGEVVRFNRTLLDG